MTTEQEDPITKAVFTYAKHGAAKEEIMNLLQLAPEDFKLFQEAFETGFNEFRHNIRKCQLSHATTNANMAIWLGKQFLNQRDFKDDGSDLKKAVDEAVGQAIQDLLKDHELVPLPKRVGKASPLKQIK